MIQATPVGILLLLVALAAFEGCASLVASNTETYLSAAGFRKRTPSTPQQRALFSQFAPYKLERRTKNGKVLYTYADKQKGIVYIGGETEYQQFKRLALEQSPQFNAIQDPADDNDGTFTQSQLKAAEINETPSLNWGPDWELWR
jgi:hypothetical protein